MTTPIAYTVHDGTGVPAGWRRKLIAEWLTANGIDPDQVAASYPIAVLTLPYRPPETADDGPWLIQVIVFHQYFAHPDGSREANLLNRQPVTFQRTVPLQTAFPPEPPSEGDQQEAGDA